MHYNLSSNSRKEQGRRAISRYDWARSKLFKSYVPFEYLNPRNPIKFIFQDV